jgi:hypothetical protein
MPCPLSPARWRYWRAARQVNAPGCCPRMTVGTPAGPLDLARGWHGWRERRSPEHGVGGSCTSCRVSPVPHDHLPCWQAPKGRAAGRLRYRLVITLVPAAHAAAPGEGPGAARSGVALGLSPAGRHPPIPAPPTVIGRAGPPPVPWTWRGKHHAGQVRRSTYRRWQLLGSQRVGHPARQERCTERGRPRSGPLAASRSLKPSWTL